MTEWPAVVKHVELFGKVAVSGVQGEGFDKMELRCACGWVRTVSLTWERAMSVDTDGTDGNSRLINEVVEGHQEATDASLMELMTSPEVSAPTQVELRACIMAIEALPRECVEDVLAWTEKAMTTLGGGWSPTWLEELMKAANERLT